MRVTIVGAATHIAARLRGPLPWHGGSAPIGRALRVLAAGKTWTIVIANAPWAARVGHTTVINAAGAIYVIGGYDGTNVLNDVLKSADGGAHRTLGYSGDARWLTLKVV